MKENFLHFLSTIPSSISINGKALGLIDNKNVFEYDVLTDTKQIYINYEPVCNTQNYLPYTAILETWDTPTTDNQYIEVIPFPENNYDILLKPFYYYELKESKILLSKSIGNYFVSIRATNTTFVTIFSGAAIVMETTIPKCTTARAELRENILIIEGVIKQNEYYILVVNTTDFSIIHSDMSHSIEYDISSIQTLKYLYNLPRNAEVCKIDIKALNKEKFYVYEKNAPKYPTNNFLTPYYFLEGLMVGDNSYVKSLLGNNICDTPLEKLKSYFGNIHKIYPNRHLGGTQTINYTIKGDNYKNYNFILNNNKIIEIEEIF